MEIKGRALKGALSVLSAINECEFIRIDGEGNFAATDQLRSASVSVDAKGVGRVIINREMLSLKASVCDPDKAVSIKEDGAALVVSQGSSRWKIPIHVDQSFHDDLVAPLETEAIDVGAIWFLSALERVSPACATDGRNLALCGVYVDPIDGYIVGADGILFFWEAMEPGEIDPFIIPSECVGPIHKIFKDCVDLELRRSENWFSISGGDFLYRAKMVDAKYPEWRKILPDAIEQTATASVQALSDAVRRSASINTRKGAGGTSGRVSLELNGKSAKLSTSNSHGEEGESELPMTSTGPVSRFLSHKRLSTALDSINWPDIALEFHSSTGTPVVMKDPRGGKAGRMIVAMYG